MLGHMTAQHLILISTSAECKVFCLKRALIRETTSCIYQRCMKHVTQLTIRTS